MYGSQTEKSISEKIPRRTSLVEEKYQIRQVLRHRPLDEKTAWVEETGSNVPSKVMSMSHCKININLLRLYNILNG
jgi:hypothetical protein